MTKKKGGKAAVAAAIDNAEPASSAATPPPGGGGAPRYLSARFEMKPDGLWRKSEDDKRMWICAPFAIEAETIDDENQSWGLLVSWRDRNGQSREEVFSRDLFSAECGELRARLARGGLAMSNVSAARQAFSEYLSYCSTDRRARSVSRVGWHQVGARPVFVMPDKVIGDPVERVVLQVVDRESSAFGVAGTAEQWRDEIGGLCCGNSRLMFYASCGFAAPLLHLVNQAGGGFNLLGKSQTGKSTALRVLASVCGGSVKDGAEGYWRSWRATGNGMEGIASMHNDTTLCLDEMGVMDAREAGEIAYMLANGQGKARATRLGGARAITRWRLLFCSTGEIGLADKNAEAGRRTQAGQEVRLVDIPIDAGAGMGGFQELHGDDTADDLAKRLAVLTARCYGAPLRTFLRRLVDALALDPLEFARTLRERVDGLARSWIADMPRAGGQVRSVAARFALVGIAGELATEMLLTGWPGPEAFGPAAAARECFDAYLALRGTVGAREDAQAEAQLRAFITLHGSTRFETWPEQEQVDGREGEPSRPHEPRFRTPNRAGWKRWEALDGGIIAWRYYITPEGMAEALKGLSITDARQTLVKLGYIVPSTIPSDVKRGVLAASLLVPGIGKTRLYKLGDAVMAADKDTA